MSEENIAIFGSTGSIGVQALDILENNSLYHISVLSANNNFRKLAKQANKFKPQTLILGNKKHQRDFEALLEYKPASIYYGEKALSDYAEQEDYDILLNSLVGFAGFSPTYFALIRNKKVALANKESLVTGGQLLSQLKAFKEGKLIPVDSEHSAMLQCILGENPQTIKKIIITASGGPFRNFTKEQLRAVTVEQALNHPNWDMGAKITIDSSTMMNKGLEIIEAMWLFDVPVESIEPVIHPQSIIHSIVEFTDGSSKAQLGPPDMKVPILYALTYPERITYLNPTLDYSKNMLLEFEPVNYENFPCLNLAIKAAKMGGYKPAVLNAANEIAVERFLQKEIRYIDIPELISRSLDHVDSSKELTPQTLSDIDKETREYARHIFT